MKKKLWKITAFFMAVALTVTCFNLENLYVHATGNDETPSETTYVKDHGVDNNQGASVSYIENTKPETLEEGQVWTGKIVTDNNDGTFTITFEAIGRKYQDNRNGGVWNNPLKTGSYLTITEEIANGFEIVENSLTDEYLTVSDGTVTWKLPADKVTSDNDGENIIDNKVSFKVKCIGTVVGTYKTNPSNVKFTPDEFNHYYYEWETVKSSTTGLVNWNNAKGNGIISVTLNKIEINGKVYNNVEIQCNKDAKPVKRFDRNGELKEFVRKTAENNKIGPLNGAGIEYVYVYNYFGELVNDSLKSYDIIMDFYDSNNNLVTTYRVKSDDEVIKVDNQGGNNATFGFNEVITHTDPVLKEEFGTSDELSFDLKNYGWIEIAEKPDIFKAEKTLDDPTQRVDNTWWIKFSLGKNAEVEFDQEVIATDVTITDEVANARFKYVDDLVVQYKKSTDAEDEWQTLNSYEGNTNEDYYKITKEKGNGEGGTLEFHFAKVTKEGIDVRFQEKANKGVYSGKDASAENPDLETNDSAKVTYTTIGGKENTIVLKSPKVFIPNPLYDVALDKTTTTNTTDWENRTYTVHLNANAIGETIIPGQENPYDIIMVLDQSSSMKEATYEYIEVPKDTSLDTNRYYYIKTESGIYRGIVASKEKWFYNDPNGIPVYIDITKEPIYERNEITNTTKQSMLETAATKFVEKVKENSPDSRIGVVSFSSDATIRTTLNEAEKTLNMLRVGNELSYKEIIDSLKLDLYGITRPDYGFKTAMNLLNNSDGYEKVQRSKGRKKLVVFFTDGIPTNNSGAFDYNIMMDGIEEAKKLQEAVTSIYSIGTFSGYGFGRGNTQEIKNVDYFMRNVATKENGKPLYFTANNLDDLMNVFNKISDTVIYHKYTGTVKDVIDSRFELAEGEEERLRNAGAKIVTKNGVTTITWPNQEIGKDGWSADFDIVAKKDFLGGNVIPTNDPTSGIIFDNGTLYFPNPTVNVKTLPLDLEDGEKTYFLGETINTTELSELLLQKNGDMVHLTTDQIKKLIEDKKLENVPYSYPGTNDQVGVFNYEIKVVKPTDMSLENHKANKKGEKVEQYQLVMTYKPIIKEERKSMMKGYLYPTAGNGIAQDQTATGNMFVNVVAGELQITKNIDKQYTDIEQIKSNQSFVFKIDRRDSKNGEIIDTFYQVIDFSANEDVATKTATIKNLKKGYYTITELDAWSWKYEEQANKRSDNYKGNGDSKGATENSSLYIGEKEAEGYYGTETVNPANANFTNNLFAKFENLYSDVASAINQFRK